MTGREGQRAEVVARDVALGRQRPGRSGGSRPLSPGTVLADAVRLSRDPRLRRSTTTGMSTPVASGEPAEDVSQFSRGRTSLRCAPLQRRERGSRSSRRPPFRRAARRGLRPARSSTRHRLRGRSSRRRSAAGRRRRRRRPSASWGRWAAVDDGVRDQLTDQQQCVVEQLQCMVGAPALAREGACLPRSCPLRGQVQPGSPGRLTHDGLPVMGTVITYRRIDDTLRPGLRLRVSFDRTVPKDALSARLHRGTVVQPPIASRGATATANETADAASVDRRA